jgi:hypothetical protein
VKVLNPAPFPPRRTKDAPPENSQGVHFENGEECATRQVKGPALHKTKDRAPEVQLQSPGHPANGLLTKDRSGN